MVKEIEGKDEGRVGSSDQELYVDGVDWDVRDRE